MGAKATIYRAVYPKAYCPREGGWVDVSRYEGQSYKLVRRVSEIEVEDMFQDPVYEIEFSDGRRIWVTEEELG